MVVWLGWFSWWAPRTLPALLLLAAVALVLTRRLRKRPLPTAGVPPPGWTPLDPSGRCRNGAAVVGQDSGRARRARRGRDGRRAGRYVHSAAVAGRRRPSRAASRPTGTGENTTVLPGDSADVLSRVRCRFDTPVEADPVSRCPARQRRTRSPRGSAPASAGNRHRPADPRSSDRAADPAAERHPPLDAGLAGRGRRGAPDPGHPAAADQGCGAAGAAGRLGSGRDVRRAVPGAVPGLPLGGSGRARPRIAGQHRHPADDVVAADPDRAPRCDRRRTGRHQGQPVRRLRPDRLAAHQPEPARHVPAVRRPVHAGSDASWRR